MGMAWRGRERRARVEGVDLREAIVPALTPGRCKASGEDCNGVDQERKLTGMVGWHGTGAVTEWEHSRLWPIMGQVGRKARGQEQI